MAIYHLNLKTIGRSQGRSATGSAAYRAGEVIHDRSTGLTFDYTRKKGIDGAEILAPPNAPGWGLSRAELWNRAEEAEKRKDAQVCREVEFALPFELTPEQNKQLARDFLNAEFVALGMVADVAFHKLTGQNPHAHALLTMRTITPEGFGPKVREWNERSLCDHWRERWAHYANEALKAAGKSERIDHRTLAEQALDAIKGEDFEQAKALDRSPTIHESRNPAAINHNHAIKAANLARLDDWEALEREAMAEARLMAPYNDIRSRAAAPIPELPTAPPARRLTTEDADTAFRAEMATATGLNAINWRAAERRQKAAAAWLAEHRDDERKHRQQVEKAGQRLTDARKARQHFDDNMPEPWGFWIFNRVEREHWQRQKRRQARAVRKAKEIEALARQVQTIAVADLDAQRQQQERAQARALAERRRLGLLPSEQEQKRQLQKIERQETRQQLQSMAAHALTIEPQSLSLSKQMGKKPKPPGMG